MRKGWSRSRSSPVRLEGEWLSSVWIHPSVFSSVNLVDYIFKNYAASIPSNNDLIINWSE